MSDVICLNCSIPKKSYVNGKCWKEKKKVSKLIEDIEKECLKK